MHEKQNRWSKYAGALPLWVIVTVGAAFRLFGLNWAPPGLHFDEAVYGLMALDIYRGRLPVFFSAYTGREPLYMYIMAAVFRAVGVGALGIRLTSALIGIATVLLAFLLFRELYHRRSAWIAAALTALNYWHLTVSRNGYPNILIPPMECLALYGLWRGYRDGHRVWMALGGAFVGGVLYTYLAARLFPVTIAILFLYVLLVDGRRFRARLGGILLAALVAALVFAPLGAYFLAHPQDFWERTNQVLAFRLASGGELPRVIAGNLVKTLGGFFWQGDPRQHYNLPGKPIFDPILAIFFAVGILVALRNWRKTEYALLPIWLIGMSLPAVLTKEPMPQGQRMFGVIPGIFGLAALGIEATSEALRSRLPASRRWLPTVALIGLLIFEGWSTAQTYFTVWVRQRDTYYIFNADYVALAREARQELDAGHTVVIQSLHYKHPTVIFIEPSTLQAVWAVGGKTLVVPAETSGEVTYLWPVVDNPVDELIAPLLEQVAEPAGQFLDPRGETMVSRYRLRPAVQVNAATAQPMASFGNEVEVLAAWCPASIRRDEPLRVLVHWRVASPPSDARTLVLHLVDENGVLWSQGGEMGYLQEQWHAGDTVYQVFEVALPPGIPAGRYQARLILFREGGAPIPVIRQETLVGVHLKLDDVTLIPDGGVIQPLASRGTPFGDELQAIEYRAPQATVVPGGKIELTVTWQARQKMELDRSVSIDLSDAQRSVQHHERALAYQYPTSSWQVGEVVQASYVLPIGSLPAGAYRIRLQVPGLPGELALGETRVEGQERLFTVPAIEHPLPAQFGQEIELLGYDLARKEYKAGEVIPLRLYWRAQAAIPGDYKVFVHLAGEGAQILAQDDSAPDQWRRPTTGWQPQEVIADNHDLALPAAVPPGQWNLWVGMYDPATMQRLPVHDETGASLPDGRLPLGTITVVP